MIPEHVMHELRYIEVYTAKKIRNQRVGVYQSPLRGAGFDFDEHQPYRPGDDVRRIDWNVTARMGAPYVRLTHAERELNVMIVIDASRSMLQGSAGYSKKEAMTFITASILFSALSDQINAGFCAFSDRLLVHTPPRRTRASAWSILEECWTLAPRAKRTLMIPVVQHLLTTLKRMTIIFFVSDFVTDDNVLESGELAQLAVRHDLIAVVPEDATEARLPGGGGYLRVRDLETGKRATIGLGRAARAKYAQAMGRRREELARAFYRVPMDHVFVPTNEGPVLPVLSLFAARKMA
ncbi:MAG: hypothetical protein DMF84_04815 [Acidobacteria bacterium]|nr:MAG: hypothetical protein DMF84_04815 [Acidobacteriota bacterium]